MLTLSTGMIAIPLIPILQVLVLATIPSADRGKIGRYVSKLCWLPLIASVIAEIIIVTAGRIEAGPFIFDRLSGALMVLISLISLIVHRFSVNYMQAERDYKGYFLNLGLLTAVLLWFVSAANIWLLASSWTGMSLFMLRLLKQPGDAVSHQAARSVMKVLVLGDAAFWVGTVLFFWLAKTASLTQGLAHVAHQPGAFMVGLLWLIAGLTKTCNIPFHRWLSITMAAPTPVSAMMHAGFVNAGGILISRCAVLYSQQPQLLMLMFLIGSLTVAYGSLKMLVQNDIKRNLAYSTIGQMGFMILQCGLGAFSVALFHLVAHSLFKSSLFLGSGSVISDSKGIYLPESQPGTTHPSRQQSLIRNLGLVIVPVLLALLLSRFIGIQGAASLLWIYPLLPLLPLMKKMAGYQIGFWGTLFFALLVQLLYAASKIIAHTMFVPDLSDAMVGLTPLYIGVMLLTVAVLCYGTIDKKRSSAFEKWLYVWLLNQPTVFNHRSRTSVYE